jgi:hypothetical protein
MRQRLDVTRWSATMILSLFVSGIETTLMTIEATNAIAMRLEMIANGDAEPLRETELMVRERLEAFARIGSDMLADVSNAIILDNFRAAIRANEVRLRRFAVGGMIDSSTPVA